MDVGIIILNYKTYIDTEKVVNHILSQSTSLNIFIQIIDNNSPNESFEFLSDTFGGIKNISIIKAPENGGYAKGNNIGIMALSKINPKYLLIINNDIYFDIKTLEHLIDIYPHMDNPGMIAPVQLDIKGEIKRFNNLKCHSFIDDILSYSLIYNLISKNKCYLDGNIDKENIEVDIVEGCFIFMDYQLMKEIGGFDESTFLFCEERFLYKKLCKLNKKNYIINNIYYHHCHSKTINSEIDIIKQQKLMLDGKVAFTKKYRHFSSLKIMLLKMAFFTFKTEYKILKVIKSF